MVHGKPPTRTACAWAIACSIAALLVPMAPAHHPTVIGRLVANGLVHPVFLASPPGDSTNLFVTERDGRVRIVNATTGAINPTPFLDIIARVSTAGDGGLLGFAFAPDYATSGVFYVYYNIAPSRDSILARFRRSAADPTVADLASEEVIWRYPRPIGHNAGWIGFSPMDGYLYVASGDGGTGAVADPFNAGQTIVNELKGKILRLDVSGPDDFPLDTTRNYAIPPTNPFVGIAGDDEIWAYGVRNPWRCAFDRQNGDLYIADVGQDLYEEINYQRAGVGGRNYGWRCMEGTACSGFDPCPCPPGMVGPLYQYDHAVGCSITGGFTYRGLELPTMYPLYLFADYCTNKLYGMWAINGLFIHVIDLTYILRPHNGAPIENVSAICDDSRGEPFILDYVNGRVYTIINRGTDCIADFDDGSGTGTTDGGVDINDLLYFLVLLDSGDIRADIDDGSLTNYPDGGVDINDLLYFLARFQDSGC